MCYSPEFILLCKVDTGVFLADSLRINEKDECKAPPTVLRSWGTLQTVFLSLRPTHTTRVSLHCAASAAYTVLLGHDMLSTWSLCVPSSTVPPFLVTRCAFLKHRFAHVCTAPEKFLAPVTDG